MFSSEGQVVDVFPSRKFKKNNPYRFAFVRFAYKNHALRAAKKFDGWNLESIQLMVVEAKYRRDNRDIVHILNQPKWVQEANHNIAVNNVNEEKYDKRSFKIVLLGGHNEKQYSVLDAKCEKNNQLINKVVKGWVDVGLMQKLERSLIGESIIPLKKDDIIPSQYKDSHTLEEIKAMGSFNWRELKANGSRRAFIVIYDMSFQAWNEKNFHRIAVVWGSVISVEDLSSFGTNYSSVKAIVDTSWLKPIHDYVHIELKGVKF
ncbi:hypothetical protein PIB30_053811 [Stylosanthes scabra]|uniref:RRM domain-containing protein n=1 Tax=Stylosanthes scabra TaxID=79078 RepID=A0ABU6QIC1_9FABA|nr:hypothetical protein [Stylosanthes scabra]